MGNGRRWIHWNVSYSIRGCPLVHALHPAYDSHAIRVVQNRSRLHLRRLPHPPGPRCIVTAAQVSAAFILLHCPTPLTCILRRGACCRALLQILQLRLQFLDLFCKTRAVGCVWISFLWRIGEHRSSTSRRKFRHTAATIQPFGFSRATAPRTCRGVADCDRWELHDALTDSRRHPCPHRRRPKRRIDFCTQAVGEM